MYNFGQLCGSICAPNEPSAQLETLSVGVFVNKDGKEV